MPRDWGKIGLCLDVGSISGARQVGFAEALYKHGIHINCIDGASVGAFNGAEIAASHDGNPEKLKKTWVDDVQSGKVTLFSKQQAIFRMLRGKNSFFSDVGIRHLADKLDINRLVSSPIEFEVAVTQETQDYPQKVYSTRHLTPNKYHRFKELIVASVSFSAGYPPVRIGHHFYSDPSNFSPERLLTKKGCDTVFFCYNHPCWLPTEQSPDQIDALNRAFQLNQLEGVRNILLSLENILLKHHDVTIWPHQLLPSPVEMLARRMDRLRKDGRKTIVMVGPIRRISSINLIEFQNNDIEVAISQGNEAGNAILESMGF